MRGYFAGLAKQSGLIIAPANRTASPVSARGQEATAAAPLHVDRVLLVEPSNRSIESSSALRLPEMNSRDTEVTYRLEGRQSSDEMSVKQIASNLTDSRTLKSSDGPARAPAPETEVLKGPSSFLKVEKSIEPQHRSEGLEEPSTKGAVIRIHEPPSESQRPDSLAKIDRLSDLPDSPIPGDYLEGIRKWLTSPATENSDAAKAGKLADESSRSISSDRDRKSPKEIQEFSLSIGSISIVVEEPAQQPVSSPVSTPTMTSQSNGNQRPGRDAFALSRNYFRGF